MNNSTTFLFRMAIIVSLAAPFHTAAQAPNADVSNKGLKLLREDAKGRYYSSADKNEDTVFYCKDMSCYKLISSDGHVAMEGELASTGANTYVKNGKWTEYFGNRIPSKVCYYNMGTETGLVQTYNINGSMNSRYNLATVKTSKEYTLKAGLYQEFHETGLKRIEGFYRIRIDSNGTDTIKHTDPVSHKTTEHVLKNQLRPVSEKAGKWFQYDVTGKVIKVEEF